MQSCIVDRKLASSASGCTVELFTEVVEQKSNRSAEGAGQRMQRMT